MLQLDGCPQGLIWKYDHTELITDSIVHAAGLGFALVGATALLLSCPLAPNLRTASIVIYAVGLVAMLGFSAAYNLWPVSPRKWWLRRFDHSAIFIFIAATYGPLIAQLNFDSVWVVAALCVALKLFLPGRFDRVSIGLCFLLGCSGVFVYDSAVAALPSSTLWLIVIGAGLYTTGVVFHLWETLRFQNFIWHTFVLLRRFATIRRYSSAWRERAGQSIGFSPG